MADQAHVRERTTIGAETVVGRGRLGRERRASRRARAHADRRLRDRLVGRGGRRVHRAGGDAHERSDRRPPAGRAMELRGATLRRGCRVGARAVLLPGIEVGAEAFVGAGAVVTRDVAPRSGGGRGSRAGGPRRAGGGAPDRMRLRRRRPLAPGRGTLALGSFAAVTFAAVVVVEVGRVWRRGRAPLPLETDDLLLAAEEAVAETAEVARVGYRGGSTRENSTFNLLAAFAATFLTVAHDHLPAARAPARGAVQERAGGPPPHPPLRARDRARVRGRGGRHRVARRAPRADPRGAVRGRAGPDARRVGAAARARGRLLERGGPAERADHARGDGDARRARSRACASCAAASSSCWSRSRRDQ